MAINDIQRKRWQKIVVSALLAMSIVAVLVLTLFFSLPYLLIRPAEIIQADVIYYYAPFSAPATEPYIAELYQQNVARKIVCLSGKITWNVYPADYAREHLIALGIPASEISTYHLPRTDCETESMNQLIAFTKENRWQKILIVTTPLSSQATYKGLSSYFGKSNLQFAVTFASAEREAMRGRWWSEHRKVQAVIQQSIANIFDAIYPQCQ